MVRVSPCSLSTTMASNRLLVPTWPFHATLHIRAEQSHRAQSCLSSTPPRGRGRGQGGAPSQASRGAQAAPSSCCSLPRPFMSCLKWCFLCAAISDPPTYRCSPSTSCPPCFLFHHNVYHHQIRRVLLISFANCLSSCPQDMTSREWARSPFLFDSAALAARTVPAPGAYIRNMRHVISLGLAALVALGTRLPAA